MEIKNQKIVFINKNEFELLKQSISSAKMNIIDANFNTLVKRNSIYIIRKNYDN